MSASNLCIPPHSKNEDFQADIAAKPFADQRAYHHSTYYDVNPFAPGLKMDLQRFFFLFFL